MHSHPYLNVWTLMMFDMGADKEGTFSEEMSVNEDECVSFQPCFEEVPKA